jgi:glycosyltransferase involved in cell wall biosynthesis
MATTRRVTVIANELGGFRPAGGMGTATTHLALALAHLGHSVEILLGKRDPRSLDPQWAARYDDAGIAIRPVPHSTDRVEPWEFAHAHNVMLGLREGAPDVVVAHDFGAPAYSSLRLRQCGLGFEDTLFVVFCHGPRRYVLDLSPKLAVSDLRAVLGVSILEQACVELADVVVSPSTFLLDWMREQGWRLPERALTIPYFTQPATRPSPRPSPDPLRRLAFFGRIDERKGLKLFAEALHAVQPGLEVEFVGKTTRTWTEERVRALLPATVEVVFTGELEQDKALERLQRPGTLVVMPSLQENSPNVVYECLEHGISFIASAVGGVPELVEPGALFEPTAAGLALALKRILAGGVVPLPPRAAFDRHATPERWGEVLKLRPAPRSAAQPAAENVLDVLRHAQRTTGADIVTCGIRLPGGGVRFFHGDPGGLGAIENGYGTVALVDGQLRRDETDLWPLLADLAASKRSIVSVPLPLTDGAVDESPGVALRAAQALEGSLAEPLRGAARLAAGLAADERSKQTAGLAADAPAHRGPRRGLRLFRREPSGKSS